MQKGAKMVSESLPMLLIPLRLVITFFSKTLSLLITEFRSKSSQLLFEIGIWESIIFMKFKKFS